METTRGFLVAGALAAALIFVPGALGQPEPLQVAPPQEEATFEGQLLQIDPEQQIIVVGDPNTDEQMAFIYTEETQVTGNTEDVQGLAAQAGAQVNVTYMVLGENNNVATRIDVSAAEEPL